jgi:TonB family protein
MPACSNCGNQNATGLKFCTSCGMPLSAPAPAGIVGRSCTSCGASIPASVKFCLQCGKPVSLDAPTPPVAAPPPEIPPPVIAPAPIAAEPMEPPPIVPPIAAPMTPPPIVPIPSVQTESPAESAWTPVKVPSAETMETRLGSNLPAIAAPPSPPKTPRKSAAGKIIVAVILLLALCGGGYYGYSVWKKSKAPQQQANAVTTLPATTSELPKPAASQPALPPPVETRPALKTPVPAVAKAVRPTGKVPVPAATSSLSQQVPVQATPPQSAPPPPREPRLPAATNSGRIRVQSVVPIRKVPLQYPPLAKSAGITGEVHLLVVIGTDGTVKDVSVISGNPILAKAAMDAVRQWVYRPTLIDGNLTEVETEAQFSFTL